MMTESELRATLATLLADRGHAALLALALACAEVVLPLYETHYPDDGRLRRALDPERRREDFNSACAAMSEILFITGNEPMREAARAVYAAVNLAVFFADAVPDARLLGEGVHCVRRAGVAVGLLLGAASAQERLDFVAHRLEGFSSFDAWLTRRLELTQELRG